MNPLAHGGADDSRRVLLIGHGGGGKKEEYRKEKAGREAGIKKGRGELKTGFGGRRGVRQIFEVFRILGKLGCSFREMPALLLVGGGRNAAISI